MRFLSHLFKFAAVSCLLGCSCAAKLVPKVVRPLKLPIWPIYSGALAQLADWVRTPKISEIILNKLGGRVVIMQLGDITTSPFILLVHHSHSFHTWDPFRYLTRFLLPEGFPAHPHAGFDTGGLKHRDSDGVTMRYGDGDIQWMRAGRGVIHEEMWDLSEEPNPTTTATKRGPFKRIEIFQLWVNLPKARKADHSQVTVLPADEAPPTVALDNGGKVKLLCGQAVASTVAALVRVLLTQQDQRMSASALPGYGDHSTHLRRAENVPASPICMLDVTLPSGGKLKLSMDSGEPVSCLVYIRRGALIVEEKEVHQETLLVFDAAVGKVTAAVEGTAEVGQENNGTVDVIAGQAGLQALVLLGCKLPEPAVMRGPFVQANEGDLVRSEQMFGSLPADAFWSHKLSNKEWRNHIARLNLPRFLQ